VTRVQGSGFRRERRRPFIIFNIAHLKGYETQTTYE
jgi:hypothetical protein